MNLKRGRSRFSTNERVPETDLILQNEEVVENGAQERTQSSCPSMPMPVERGMVASEEVDWLS